MPVTGTPAEGTDEQPFSFCGQRAPHFGRIGLRPRSVVASWHSCLSGELHPKGHAPACGHLGPERAPVPRGGGASPLRMSARFGSCGVTPLLRGDHVMSPAPLWRFSRKGRTGQRRSTKTGLLQEEQSLASSIGRAPACSRGLNQVPSQLRHRAQTRSTQQRPRHGVRLATSGRTV
jgi:hypothetical protein